MHAQCARLPLASAGFFGWCPHIARQPMLSEVPEVPVLCGIVMLRHQG